MEGNNFKKAVFMLLHDQFDVPDLNLDDSDESFVDSIVYTLIEQNENLCPYKIYSCSSVCKNSTECTNELKLNCSKEAEDVWREFIEIQ